MYSPRKRNQVEVAAMIAIYGLLFLLPLNLLALIAIQQERKKIKTTLRGYWRLFHERKR